MMRRPSGDHGAVAVLTALLSVLLLSVGALAVDLGNAYSRKRAVQTTADLAALAGATQLPSAACALSAAFDYLTRNGAQDDNDDVPTFAQMIDGDTGNGEIIVRNASNGPDVVSDLVNTAALAGAACLVPDKAAREIRVVAPPRRVEFGLAGVMGFSGVDVTAGATAALRTIGNIQPLGIPAGCATAGYVAVKISSQSETSCSLNSGNFGFLDLYRADANNNLFENLRNGADHGYGMLPPVGLELPVPLSTVPCPEDGTSSNGVGPFLHDIQARFTQNPNCVHVQTGNIGGVITDAFIRKNNESCINTGRLTRVEAVHATRTFDPGGGIGGACKIEGRRFRDFFNKKPDGTSYTIAEMLASPAGKPLSSEITQSPAFFVVPLLYAHERPQNANQYYRVSGFRGFYLDYNDGLCAGTGVGALAATQITPLTQASQAPGNGNGNNGNGNGNADPSPTPSTSIGASPSASPDSPGNSGNNNGNNGNGNGNNASPSPAASAVASATPSPTPAPTTVPVVNLGDLPCSPYETNGQEVYDDAGQITGVTGYAFDLELIANSANTGNVSNYYIGSGPAAPVLIRDPLN